jgi:hypothetical protein
MDLVRRILNDRASETWMRHLDGMIQRKKIGRSDRVAQKPSVRAEFATRFAF